MPSIVYKKSVEGFGIAFIEAAQYGIPSIGGKDGGAADAIEHQKNGLICDGNSLDEIYSSINDILNNKKYLEYGKIAKENSTKFYWDKIIEKYKKILNFLNKMDTTKSDIALYKNNKILESGTSNLLFIKKNKIYSPINYFYRGTTLKFFKKKIKKIKEINIFTDSLNDYDEIIVIGSGKGVVSVNSIEKTFWKRKSLKNYRILSKIYQQAVINCPRYNGWSIISTVLET